LEDLTILGHLRGQFIFALLNLDDEAHYAREKDTYQEMPHFILII
jgi:hypothetical protein